MSVATEILKTAIAASEKLREEHAAGVRATAERFVSHIGNPWKWRLEAIEEAKRTDDDQGDAR